MLWVVVISYTYLSWRLKDCLATAEFGYDSYEEAHGMMALRPLMMSQSATPHKLLNDLWKLSIVCMLLFRQWPALYNLVCVPWSSTTGRKIVWIFPLFCLVKMLQNRMLKLINQWVRFAITHKLWLVLLELVIHMAYIITEYINLNCWQTSDIHKV